MKKTCPCHPTHEFVSLDFVLKNIFVKWNMSTSTHTCKCVLDLLVLDSV